MSKKLRYACLFSGIGAPLQGAYRVYGKENIEHIFSCEYDKFARQSFKALYNIDDEHFHADIRDLDATKYCGKVDILVGGSPCQAFSMAGLRNGTNDERGQLIYQYIRIVDEVKAPIIIYENVKGMISIHNGNTIKEFVQALRDIGYYCHYEVINTKDYGVPQNRERIFLVGFLDYEHYHRFSFAPKQKLAKRLKDVLETDVDEKYYLSATFIETSVAHKKRHEQRGNGFSFAPKTGNDICGCIATKYGARQTDTFINEGVIGKLDIKGDDYIKRVYGTDGVSPCLPTMQGGNQEPKIIAMGGRNKDNLVLEREYAIRKLTPLEVWRLQDFPDEAHEAVKAAGVSDSQRYKQAGNSMSVNVLEMIFKQIDKALRGEAEGLFA